MSRRSRYVPDPETGEEFPLHWPGGSFETLYEIFAQTWHLCRALHLIEGHLTKLVQLAEDSREEKK